MGMRDVDLNELLIFQKKFIDHTRNIQIFSKQLRFSVQNAEHLLCDKVSQKNLEMVKDIAEHIERIGRTALNEMESYAENTKKQIDKFENM